MKLSEHDLNKLKLIKLEQCLSKKQAKIQRKKSEEQSQTRGVRSAENREHAEQSESLTSAFERLLSQFNKLKDSVAGQSQTLQQQLNSEQESCQNMLRCDNTTEVIQIKKAVLSSDKHQQMCTKTQLFSDLTGLDEVCHDEVETTKILKEM
jgi:hypothetical protein